MRSLRRGTRRLINMVCRRPDMAMVIAVIAAGVAGLLMLANLTGDLLAEQHRLRVEIEEITEEADVRAQAGAELTRQAMLCLLAEHGAHRTNTFDVHHALASAHGLVVTAPPPAPVPNLLPSEVACAPFGDGSR